MNGEIIQEKARNARWPWVAAGIIFLLGAAITLWAWNARRAMDQTALAEDFGMEAGSLFTAVGRELDLFMNVLDSIRTLHNISEHINSADFDELVQKGMRFQQQIMGAFGFVQRINQDLRENLEKQIDENGTPVLLVLERDANGEIRPAGLRTEYYPLTYQNPDLALGAPVGFDFASEPVNRQAIERMKVTGRFALGAHVQPLGSGKNEGVYVLAPIVYSEPIPQEPPRMFLVGFAVAILKPSDLLDRILPPPAVRGVKVQLIDTAPDQETTGPVFIQSTDELQAEFPLLVADQMWTLRCTATDDFVRARQTQHSSTILVAGLIITILLTSLMLLLANRTRQIENTVRTRTAALRDVNFRLQEEMTERARLESEILEIGSREKQRVGQDLHDSIGQKLTGAVFLSRTLMDHLTDAPKEDRESAQRINETLKETVAQVRRVARGLAPVELTEEGLNDALKRFAEDAGEMYDIACAFTADGDSRVKDIKTATHLYHIAQEAVNNAARHGKAGEVTIRLTVRDGKGQLTVEDDGEGLPENAEQRGGLGLKIMRYRSEMIGGQLEIASKPEGGTVITCWFGV